MKRRGWIEIPKNADIMQAIEKARAYIADAYGIPRDAINIYAKKSGRTFGTCYYMRRGGFWEIGEKDITIAFNNAVIDRGFDYAEYIAPLVAHEFAHAVEYYANGKSGHGYAFNHYARKIAEAIGGNPEIAAETYERRADFSAAIKPATVYGLRAIGCDWIGSRRYLRRGDAVRAANRGCIYRGGVMYYLTVCEYRMEAREK